MDIKTLLNKAKITPKQKALFNYLVGGDKLSLTKRGYVNVPLEEDDYKLFKPEELRILVEVSDEERNEFESWTDLLSYTLFIDLTAEKFYHQLVSGLLGFPAVGGYRAIDKYIREVYENFLTKAFIAMLLDMIFQNILDLRSAMLIPHTKFIERLHHDRCFCLKGEYLRIKGKIKSQACRDFKKAMESVSDYEYISEDKMGSLINKICHYFDKSVGI